MMLSSLFSFWCFFCGVAGILLMALAGLMLIIVTYERYDEKAKWDAESAVMEYENAQWEKRSYSKWSKRKKE